MIKFSGDDVRLAIAIWGALTGTVAFALTVWNHFTNRARLRFRLSEMSPRFVEGAVAGIATPTHFFEIMNSGRRTAHVYFPEFWFFNQNSLLTYRRPSFVLRDGKFETLPVGWTTTRLNDSEVLIVAITVAKDQKVARVDVADALGKIRTHWPLGARYRWVWARFVTRRINRHWADLRDQLLDRDRPPHHTIDR